MTDPEEYSSMGFYPTYTKEPGEPRVSSPYDDEHHPLCPSGDYHALTKAEKEGLKRKIWLDCRCEELRAEDRQAAGEREWEFRNGR